MITRLRVAAFGLSACTALIASFSAQAIPIAGVDRAPGADRHLVQYYYP
jgi:hypothetical protein